jgi:phage terminase small subunit
MTTAPRKQPKAKREVAPLEPPVDAAYGPAMAALNEKQRLFVRGLFELPGGKHGAATRSARAAGYGSPTSSAQSFASIASRLCADPKIQEAIQEVSRQYVTTMGPLAVRALKNLLGDKAHRDHGRSLGLVMDRIAPLETTHHVKVNHDATPALRATAEVLARIADLAARAGVDLSKLPPMIDVTPASKPERAA